MPQPGLHLLLARETLDRWAGAPATAPFDAADDALANAFLHGALGPDMGFFPGGPQPLSELLHESGSGSMTRALLAHARTPAQTAYAWGWLTHVIADVLMHPIVNAGAAELTRARGAADATDLLVAHVQIEVGLDAVYLRRSAARRLRLRSALDEDTVAFVAQALADVYGMDWSVVRLAAVHRNVTRFANACLPFVAAVGRSARAERAGGSFWTPTRHLLARWVGRRTPAHGFLVPVLPARDFLRHISLAARAFHLEIDAAARGGVAVLPDHDLNTGARLTALTPAAPLAATG